MNKAALVHQIPGTRILVDAFRRAPPSNAIFFLSHFHADHYDGLTAEWNAGPILCSEITATLVKNIIGVNAEYVQTLPMDQEISVGDGTFVTLLDANHCPGACLLLFRTPDGKHYLHTGDMRYHPKMQTYPALKAVKVDTIFLDTTYSHPRYDFAPQEDAMEAMVQGIIERLKEEGQWPKPSPASSAPPAPPPSPTSSSPDTPTRTLFLTSAYKLGKERTLLHLARRIGLPVLVDEAKLRVLSCLDFSAEEMEACFTTDPTKTSIHVCRMGLIGEMWPYFRPNFKSLQKYLEEQGWPQGFTRILGFIPTGWAEGSNYNKRNALREKGPSLSIQLIPYSEHSNFPELYEFVKFIRPRCVVPIVYADDKDREKIAKRFRAVVDNTANKRAFLSLFGNGSNSSNNVNDITGDDKIDRGRSNEEEEVDGGGGEGDVIDVDDEGEEGRVGIGAKEKEEKEEVIYVDEGGEGRGGEEGGRGGVGYEGQDKGKEEKEDVVYVDEGVKEGGRKEEGRGGGKEGGGGWACQVCTYQHVDGAVSKCLMCGTSKEGGSNTNSDSNSTINSVGKQGSLHSSASDKGGGKGGKKENGRGGAGGKRGGQQRASTAGSKSSNGEGDRKRQKTLFAYMQKK